MPIEEYRKSVADQKRQAILDAAVQNFLATGYERTTLEMVAKSAGVSTATVYKHFSTKRALFGGIMERIWETEVDLANSVDQGTDSVAILMAIAQEYAQLLRQPQVEALFRVIIAEAPRFPELGEELYHRGKEPYLKRLHAYLQKESELERFQIADIPLAARQFLGMINDVIFWPRFLIVDLKISDSDIEHVITSAVETFLARYAKK
ncbi:MAG: TetR/AcrR family transcriptional regulator [Oscillatoriophycideae cyanobacterium NC_groundwater_1537_Pr4_S-0.65um_50_18]|nr:TetR/AcrR family transcriptional regulator [Oscillatoriophycideae cyanobacterium NC_groundwater_1537_Pr4_S-0.65um_50_18]